jgi:chitinase
MRRPRTVLALLAAPLLVLGAVAGLAPASAAAAPPARYAAPYLQITSGDAGDMAADLSASGDKYYTLAFLIPQSGCTPEWEDNGDAVGAFTSQVNSLKAAGGTAIISFGGESGGEIAQTCTSGAVTDRRLRQRGEHLRGGPAGLRHRGRHARRHGREQPA